MSARGRVLGGGVSGRTHRSAPTRSGKISAAHKTILCGSLCHGAGRSPPPTGGAGVDRRRGVVTPPYGSSAGGAQRRADVGIGPYALRGDERAARRGRRALRVVAESRRDCPGQRRTAKRLRRGWEELGGIRAEIIPKGGINAGQSLSRSTGDSSLCTREPLGKGGADCRVGPAGLLAMTTVFCHSEERSDVGIRPFYDGRWTRVRAAEVVGPYGRSTEVPATGRCGHRPLRVVAESCRDHSGSA